MTTRALVAASAKPIVLSLLITGESYGYQILQRVRLVSGGTLKLVRRLFVVSMSDTSYS